MAGKWYSPKEVEIRIVDGKRIAFLRPPPDPIEELEKKVKALEQELKECREYWYDYWQRARNAS